jgi:hypothetical protein
MSKVYTLGEVAAHNKDKDAWLVIDGRDPRVSLCLHECQGVSKTVNCIFLILCVCLFV